eukprot:CAMPEP_0113525592 /NCGR_PEP_ID=MMETSP0015_2-20120614/253_1 /TAXON_ID=2838 /ORGANISM="Odontella" /LENGTH=103 /DNA_ID=CAMNT_0000423787 /DNA_START=1359 /DNA_END=1667 /DNA_ORIENTATION=+ /assembly_acc=CAM_ASM_000160
MTQQVDLRDKIPVPSVSIHARKDSWVMESKSLPRQGLFLKQTCFTQFHTKELNKLESLQIHCLQALLLSRFFRTVIIHGVTTSPMHPPAKINKGEPIKFSLWN